MARSLKNRLAVFAEHGPRAGPFREGAFTSRLHDERTAALLGIALGISFSVCFLTGLISHGIQHPPGWFLWPSRPVNLYRITQGIHVATGIASIPLLFAKLWTVYPKLFAWPPVENVAHAIERVSLLPLVGGSVFMLFTGLENINGWTPFGFFFPVGHFWGAWITIGALIVHIGAKGTLARAVLRRQPRAVPGQQARADTPDADTDGLTRRGFLTTVGATAGLLTLTTIGQTLRPLRRFAVLAPRRPDIGPQGFPINKTARDAGVLESARDPAYRLVVTGAVTTALSLSLDEINAMPHYEAALPIACVEGWSAVARWRGVRLRDVLDRAGARPESECIVESLQRDGAYRQSRVNRLHARDPDTLLALEVNGETLHIEHGYPLRLIGPNRPGVMQTKWLSKITVI